ncbi:hypothetical protein [Chitinophaga cymbidii]|uniref:Lantibiotic ABC transporter permease n=1 Tax=Chitinophaga cymbidii TaxID=1096750 RepID=A0A512RSF4_9BACT|nr:hypothetical protein [Chitinophaga cymbidii]GEP98619.1 hypothetical protein CCY01nite_48790 [Chitinophaga cymbidii]
METIINIPRYRQRIIFNVVGLLIVIAVNVLSSTGRLNNKTAGELSEKYPNLFVPAGVTFSIWGLIYLALAGFAAYQLWLAFSRDHELELEAFVRRMRGWFLLNCLGNTCWLFAWHYEWLPLSMFFMLVIIVSLIMIHRNFRIAHSGASPREKLFIHFPFGVYFGWISIATIANVTVLLISLGIPGFGLSGLTWTVSMMCLGTVLALFMILRFNNIYYGLACIWAFYGIVLKQDAAAGTDPAIVVSTGTIVIAVLGLAVLLQLLRKKAIV